MEQDDFMALKKTPVRKSINRPDRKNAESETKHI